jgi:hypothetical protein
MKDQDDQYATDDEELGEPEEGGGIIEDVCVAVPEGEYELRYIFYETGMYWNSPKVVVHFAITDPDEYAGLPVYRFYNVKKLVGRYRKYGGFIAPPRGALVREFKQLIKEPDRLDRISFRALKGKRIFAHLDTVTRAHNRKALAVDDQYSRVAELIRINDEDFIP